MCGEIRGDDARDRSKPKICQRAAAGVRGDGKIAHAGAVVGARADDENAESARHRLEENACRDIVAIGPEQIGDDVTLPARAEGRIERAIGVVCARTKS